ncbi:MAG: NADPH:quinone oxidoreductase family protein [Myxococcota bacterium]
MRAVVVEEPCEPRALRVRDDVDEPAAAPGEVVVAVRAAALNFSDVLLARGRYQERPPLPFVLGRELAGEVAAVGEGVAGLAPGDRVAASGTVGAFAERAAVAAARCIRVPDALDFARAAALPITYGTSHAALVDRAALRRGETVLVHAAAGGTGLAAVQIAAARGARVFATAGGAEKCALALAHGAERAVDTAEGDFVERVRAWTDGRGVDVVFDPVGGDTALRSLDCLAWKGRLLVVGFASGDIPALALDCVQRAGVDVVGVNWPGFEARAPERARALLDDLFALAARGALRPAVALHRGLEAIPEALAALAERRTQGKLVVEVARHTAGEVSAR